MSVPEVVPEPFLAWYRGLKALPQYEGRPAKGTVAAALIVLERLRQRADFDLASHLAPGGAQISGLNLSALVPILARFGETRPFPSEGGRTNRGNNRPIADMLLAVHMAGIGKMRAAERTAAIDAMQRFLVGTLGEYYLLEQLEFAFDRALTVRAIISSIIEKARERRQAGPVAQHLVGAKLSLRFPAIQILNRSTSAADQQTGEGGDFTLGTTVFHVTAAATSGHVERCRSNLDAGLRVYLLVTDNSMDRARLRVDDAGLLDRVAIESVESFASQNISEIAEFTTDRIGPTLASLLRIYNARVGEVETDMTLRITIPAGLR